MKTNLSFQLKFEIPTAFFIYSSDMIGCERKQLDTEQSIDI